MNWQDIVAIVGSLGAFMFWMFNKLDADMKSNSQWMQGNVQHLTAMQAEQSKRTDKLYQIVIDLLKERK